MGCDANRDMVITMPPTLLYYYRAFEYSGVTKLVFLNNIRYFNSREYYGNSVYVFKNMKKLKELDVHYGLPMFWRGMFKNDNGELSTNLEWVEFPENWEMEENAYSYTNYSVYLGFPAMNNPDKIHQMISRFRTRQYYMGTTTYIYVNTNVYNSLSSDTFSMASNKRYVIEAVDDSFAAN